MQYLTSFTAACLLSMVLSGCGFQLKGTPVGEDGTTALGRSLHGQVVRLASRQPRSDLTAMLSQQLTYAGAQLDASDGATLLLNLGEERFDQRNLSLTTQARSAEVELTMSTQITLTQGNRVLINSDTVSVVRQFYNDPRNVVGKNEELRLLRNEMRQDLAAQIIRRTEYSLGG